MPPIKEYILIDGIWVPEDQALGDIDTFNLGTTKPVESGGAKNVGVGFLSAPPTTEWTGDLVVTTNGDEIENLIIHGRLVIRASGVKARNCKVDGGSQTTSQYLIDTNHINSFGFEAEFMELSPLTLSSYWNGIGSYKYQLSRSWIHGTVDGASIFSSGGAAVNVALLGNVIGGLAFFKPEIAPPSRATGTHNDAIQFQGGIGGLVQGNALYGHIDPALAQGSQRPFAPATNGNAAIQLNANTGPLTQIQILDNWMSGGGYTLNGGGAVAYGGTAPNGSIYRNKVIADAAVGSGNQIVLSSQASGILTGDGTANKNVIDPGGAEITIKRNG